MELKNWNEYTDLEKKRILCHAFCYYRKGIFTIQEYQKYETFIEKAADDLFSIYIASFCCDLCGQTIILKAIREDKVDSVIAGANKYLSNYDENELSEATNYYINECVKTINNPESPIKRVTREIEHQIKELILRQN